MGLRVLLFITLYELRSSLQCYIPRRNHEFIITLIGPDVFIESQACHSASLERKHSREVYKYRISTTALATCGAAFLPFAKELAQ